GRRQGVIFPTGDHEVASGFHGPVRGDIERPQGRHEFRWRVQRDRVQIDIDAAGPAHVSQVLCQAVTHVEHGRGTQPGRLRPRRVGRGGAAVFGQAERHTLREDLVDVVRATFQQGQPRGGQTQVTGAGDHVTGPSTVTTDRFCSLEVPQGGDRDREYVRSHHVYTHHSAAGDRALRRDPGGELVRTPHR